MYYQKYWELEIIVLSKKKTKRRKKKCASCVSVSVVVSRGVVGDLTLD